MERVSFWNLRENPLTTDYVEVAHEGFRFKGGAKFVLHYYTYRDPWSDTERVKRFKKLETLEKFYRKIGRGDVCKDYDLTGYLGVE